MSTSMVVGPAWASEDWATVRLVRREVWPLKDGDFVVFKGPHAHREAEEFADRVIQQRYGRAVEWFEVNPWDPRCEMVAQVKGGGAWIKDVYFIIG